jgi:hypothetical protein
VPDLPPFNTTTTAGESDYSKGAAHSINANYRVTEAVNLSYTHTQTVTLISTHSCIAKENYSLESDHLDDDVRVEPCSNMKDQ